MDRILYIVEGEIEERFFRFLIEEDYIYPGKIKVFNLMQARLRETNHIFTKKVNKIFAVVDTDIAKKSNIETLEYNISMLKHFCPKHVFLLIQSKSFEDELKYMLSCKSMQAVWAHFQLRHHSTGDVKAFLTQSVHYSEHITTTNLQRYCTHQSGSINKLSPVSQALCVSIAPCLLRKRITMKNSHQ